jgi:hypothetical protein
VVGQVTGITGGVTDSIISQFQNDDLVKLKVANVNEVNGNLQIAFTHPLDITKYKNLWISVIP